MTHETQNRPAPENEVPLQGWKEVAAYLERDERTARRWEREEALPIRRHRTAGRSSVYAFPGEIDAWRNRRQPTAIPEAGESDQPSRHPWAWAALAATAALAAFLLFLRSPSLDPVAQAGAASDGIRTTEICGECDWIGQVSPDGRYLSETDWVTSGDIGIRDLQTGELRRLGDKHSWDLGLGEADRSLFSPDGKQIAYNWLTDRSGEPSYELRTIEPFAEHPEAHTIYFNPELRYIEPKAWTADGRLLVWLQRKDWSVGLGFVSIQTGELTVVKSLARNASSAILSPDSRWIVYDAPSQENSPDRDIYLLAADGSSEKQATTHRANDFAMGFTPDGKTLLFASNRAGSYGLWGMEISPDGQIGDSQILMRDLGSVRPMSVAPDGALIYARAVGSVDLLTAELDLATGRVLSKPRVIETDYQGANSGPWLSPDGKRFAFIASPGAAGLARGARPRLLIRERASGQEREIDFGDRRLNGYDGLVWAPDNKRLLLPSSDPQGRWAAYEVDLDSGKTRKILDLADQSKPRPIGWGRDGKTIYFRIEQQEMTDGVSEKWIVRLAPGQSEPEKLYTSSGKGSNDRILAPTLSPQRDQIAWRELTNPECVKVLFVDGGEPRVLLQDKPGEDLWTLDIAWTPDGSSLLLTRKPKGASASKPVEVWVVPVDGSAPRKTELGALSMRHLSVHSDGKTVFYQAGSADFRIFKTENYLPPASRSSE